MRPAARYAAAIEVLDLINTGDSAERVLTTWARQNRFAGSKDRAAVRDHVYDVLRARRSLAALGGGDSGRQLVSGLLRREGINFEDVFGAGAYGPDALNNEERAALAAPVEMSDPVACDIPDWLWPMWQADLGDSAQDCAMTQQNRATPMLRVNLRRATREEVITRLAVDDITAVLHPDVSSALYVVENARRIAQSDVLKDGLVALQDAASQMAVNRLSLPKKGHILDFCAGGGGKALAMADRCDSQIFAHDIAVARMIDIAPRASAAGVTISTLTPREIADAGGFDLVFCDAPCSGSGTWRRTPNSKWQMTPEKLLEYNVLQAEVLSAASQRVAAGGALVYATCSVLRCENDAIVAGFRTAQPGWAVTDVMRLHPDPAHDGFYMTVLRRDAP